MDTFKPGSYLARINHPGDIKLTEEGRLQITAVESAESRTVDVFLETTSVIQGEALERAKSRSQSIKVY